MSGDLRGALAEIGRAVGDVLGAPPLPEARVPDRRRRPSFIVLAFLGGAVCGASFVCAAYFVGIFQGSV